MISIIIPVKGRLNHVIECLPTWLYQTYTDIEIIVVDFNCPQYTGKWIEQNISDKRIKVVYAKVRQQYWNLCQARNLGIKHSTGDMLGIFDADTIMKPDFIKESLSRMGADTYMNGNQVGHNHGCCIVSRENMLIARGYNEYLKGWGMDDRDLYKRFVAMGLSEISFKDDLIYLLQHEDSLRVQFQPYKNIQSTNHINYWISVEGKRFKGL